MSGFPLLLASAAALLVGWSINHGGICAVGATHDFIERRNPRLAIGIVFASATAGLLLLPLAWASNGQYQLAGSVAISGSLVLGAALLGLGAVINDACLLGSLGRLGNGELRFLGLPVGLALGYAFATIAPVDVHHRATVFDEPTPAGWWAIAAFVTLFILTGIVLCRDRVHIDERRRPLLLAMLVLGVCGGLLYASRPGWGYADAVQRGLSGPPLAMIDGAVGSWLALMTVSGSIGAALIAGRCMMRRPTFMSTVRSVAGGALMAVGAVRVPGGNDSLLLAAVPSGSPSGVVALLTMSLVVLLLLLAVRQVRNG